MKKYITLILSLSIGFQSCNSEKKYSDYNEKDFYEVQGIITSAIPTSDPFDLPPMKDFKFDYFLSDSIPLNGEEKNIQSQWAKQGVPIIVLVHKKDEKISFFGRPGVKDNLTINELVYLNKYFKNLRKMEKKVTRLWKF